MALFFVSNFVITLLAILYNRFSRASISAKLSLSAFSLICWVIPFTLIRDYLPQDIAVNVHWVLPATTNLISTVAVSTQPSLLSQITLVDVFMLASLIGLLFFIIRTYKHKQWLAQLRKDPETMLVCKHQGRSVYASNLIHNALLIGYNKPSIWINPKLIDSTYLEIVLEHEATHIKHKDNYWLAIMEFAKSIYWWNPLLNILTSNVKDYLEARCDHKTSHLFTEGIYQQKLTDLILMNMPVSNAGFVSAVISKNSNIRRLKSLKEKQNMNLFSKIFISLLLTSSIAILTFPISTFNSLADSKQIVERSDKKLTNPNSDSASIERIEIVEQSDKELINLTFDSTSIENVTKIIADYFHLEAVVSEELKTKLVSIYLKDVPEDKLLEALTNILEVKFEILDHLLRVSPLQQAASPNDIGVLLNIKIEASSHTNKSDNTTKVESQMWSHFDMPMSIKISNEWEFEITVRKNSSNLAIILIDTKIYLLTSSGDRELLATPRVFTTDGNIATITTGKTGEKISFRAEILPYKKRYSEVSEVAVAQTTIK